jgi:hypothetical protein
MKLLIPLPFLLAALFASCETAGVGSAPSAFSDHLNPKAKYVRERADCANPESATIGELAMSLPVFESRNIEHFIASGDIRPEVSQGKDAWLLRGDGGQRPVLVRRLTAVGSSPVRIRVVIGASPPEDPRSATQYDLEHVPGGWKVLSAIPGHSASFHF